MQLFKLPPALVLLAISATISASSPRRTTPLHNTNFLSPRGIPIRPPKDGDGPSVPVPHDNPWSESAPPAEHPGSTTSWSESPPDTNEIEYQPAPSSNPCLGAEKCDEVLEVAADLMEQLADLAQNLAGGGGSTTTSMPSFTMSGNFSRTAIATATPTALYPNVNIANRFANLAVDQEYIGLLSSDEQDMLVQEPVCFYAGAERIYSAAASSTPTSAPSRRQLYGLASCINTPDACQSTTSTLAASSTSAVQNIFFATILPGQLLEVYAQATISTAGNVLSTHATSCTGFDGVAYGTSFVREEAASVTTEAAATTGPAGETGAAVRVGGRVGGVLVGLWGVGVGMAIL